MDICKLCSRINNILRYSWRFQCAFCINSIDNKKTSKLETKLNKYIEKIKIELFCAKSAIKYPIHKKIGYFVV